MQLVGTQKQSSLLLLNVGVNVWLLRIFYRFTKKKLSQEETASYNQFPVLSFLDEVLTLMQLRQKCSFCILSSIAIGYCILL